MCVIKSKNIGNGWKEFKTTNDVKIGDHVVFTLIVASTFKVEVVDNIKNCKIICKQQALKDVVDHYFPSTIPCLGTTHTSKRGKNKFTNEIEAIAIMLIYNIIFKHNWICF
jgi:hypothetical protein